MKTLNHPNILPVIGVCLETNDGSGSPFMVLPFTVNGDLKSYLKNKKKKSSICGSITRGKELANDKLLIIFVRMQ